MKPSFIASFKQLSHNVIHNISANRSRGRVIKKFAKRVGLIYFGAVNQHDDEHQIVRGFTVSSTHHDNHYCVGSVDNYDITLVDRIDANFGADGSAIFNNWAILSFKLQTRQDVPHIFINANDHLSRAYNNIFKIYPTFNLVKFGTFEQYDLEFNSRFNIFASIVDSIEVERLIPASSTRVLGAHFWPYSAEIYEGYLFVYCDSARISNSTLDTMFEGGLWLARHIDSQIELI